ncbi:ZYRO0F17094p [Zygosaccharomyces rouxii]|uniref:Plasma membrane fusion protein PRM1 n=1 Tax=Zygosaccharomyces rouxii (strain ATCC 2623 / CBS 732 / NBRC 1130 / NCYC 568 / NRRL Y-229) TaxID=559307 RepID=C5DZ01_ZYGRC|nr:uncharacterized protein ZYRO0F17094g [Zygosaccharomyces rouxii]KAH9201276.1 hypothetical protein LQ764DRAFT_76723 [Zygosaccharomyces rouxii]CAR29012.1 ZYRO0F17094p [Zygosaccharomyces rouxii]
MVVFTSYLQLRDRLSQVWLNKYTLVLFLAMVKLIFFSKSIENSIKQSENYILSHCNVIDSIYAETVGSTPHYMAVMGNFLIREAMIQSVRASLMTLTLLVYASEGLLNFVIDLYLGTYACLIISAVDGSVDVATNATEKLLGAVNHSISAVANDIDDGLDDISKVVNKLVSAAHKVEDLFKGDKDNDASDHIHKINLTVDSLRNLHIPSSINNKLQELSDKTPDFAQAKNLSKRLVSVPFEEVIKEIKKINATRVIGNSSLLYIPPKNSSNSSQGGICKASEPDIRKFYDGISHALTVTTVICTVLLVIGALCATIPVAYSEFKLWGRLLEMRTQYTEKQEPYAISDDDSTSHIFRTREEGSHYDLIASYHQCFHHWNFRISNALVSLVERFSPQHNDDNGTKTLQRARIRWAVAYVTSERALCVLGIGLLGLAVTILQLILVAVLQKSLKDVSDSSKDLKDTQMGKILEQDMAQWTHSANLYINNTQNNVNEHVFGWVDKTTVAVNHTVNEVINEIDHTLVGAFNGTLLQKPMKAVVGCVIENKLYAIEKAMTWIHDKARLDLPDINLSQIKDAMENSKSPSSPSILPKITHEIHATIKLILDGFHKTAIYQLLVALSLLGIWFLQIPIALIIAFYRTTRISKY